MSGHVQAEAAWDGTRLHLIDPVAFHARMRRLKPGVGEEFRIMVGRPEDLISHGQRKYYYGRIITPLVEFTGYRKDEWHGILKGCFMPDGKLSIMELTHDEMRDYIEACEHESRIEIPEAFEQFVSLSA